MLAVSSVLGVQVGSTAPAFLAILAVHAPAGTVAVVSGAGAALSRKGSARHVRFGRRYYAAIAVVFVTGSALAALRWRGRSDLDAQDAAGCDHPSRPPPYVVTLPMR